MQDRQRFRPELLPRPAESGFRHRIQRHRIVGECLEELIQFSTQTMRSRIEPMKKFARTMRTHRELVLNYFRARKRFSSGVVEGLNNKAKVTMRKSYGFRTFKATEIALYHALGKLPEPKLAHSFY
ncbi:MAG: transposase [Sedimenticolaceae bacterium]